MERRKEKRVDQRISLISRIKICCIPRRHPAGKNLPAGLQSGLQQVSNLGKSFNACLRASIAQAGK
jgi:hypothetical protein